MVWALELKILAYCTTNSKVVCTKAFGKRMVINRKILNALDTSEHGSRATAATSPSSPNAHSFCFGAGCSKSGWEMSMSLP